MAEKEYDIPVYGTQGGGLAEKRGSNFYFVESPNHSGLRVGDAVPDGWDVQPANQLAREESSDF